MSALLLVLASQAACPEPTFTFVGQPACVELDFEGQTTRIVNRCAGLVLLDQSVVLPGSTSLVPPGATATIRDLNRFGLAAEGRLYAVVATVAQAACEPTPPR